MILVLRLLLIFLSVLEMCAESGPEEGEWRTEKQIKSDRKSKKKAGYSKPQDEGCDMWGGNCGVSSRVCTKALAKAHERTEMGHLQICRRNTIYRWGDR